MKFSSNLYQKRDLKIWQFWMPKLEILSYNIYYIPKIFRQTFAKSTYLVKINYLGKGDYYYYVPKGLTPLAVRNKELIISASTKKIKYKLRPYLIGLVISLLGMTFRFKVFIKLKGLGYKVYILNVGKTINLKLGFSHTVNFNFKFGMFATRLGIKDRMFSVEGNNWIVLTNTLARIQRLKRIDYYRGKGIFKKFFIYKIRQGKKKKK